MGARDIRACTQFNAQTKWQRAAVRAGNPSQSLSELETGDAKDPLQSQRWDGTGIHARRLEHRGEPQAFSQRHGLAVDAGDIEEYLAAAHVHEQGRGHRSGGGAVIGEQRTDLVTHAAWADYPPTGKPAIAQEGATGVPRCTDPGAQERRSWGREHRA